MPKRKFRGSRTKIPKGKFSAFYQKYRFELTALILLSLGVFLLTEKLEIRSTIFRFLKNNLTVIFNILSSILEWIKYIATNFENSDIVGSILIVLAILILAHRYRIHLWGQYKHHQECPQCGADVIRVHRTLLQKVFGIILFTRILNYKCKRCSHHFPVVTPRK